jgi:hypothetical protein
MSISKFNQWLLGALLSVFCLGQAGANAIVSYTVGPIPSLTGEAGSHGGLHTSHPFITNIFGTGSNGWCVAIDCDPLFDGDGLEPYTISADPQAAVWIKELLPPRRTNGAVSLQHHTGSLGAAPCGPRPGMDGLA